MIYAEATMLDSLCRRTSTPLQNSMSFEDVCIYVHSDTSWKFGCRFLAVSCSVISAARWSGLAGLLTQVSPMMVWRTHPPDGWDLGHPQEASSEPMVRGESFVLDLWSTEGVPVYLKGLDPGT